ncbi:MAG TPA: aldo/keto reductase [Acidobacteriota bacterium]|nr:aldo/keto reductase [Acidobacteriota bacterium]
MKRRVSRREFIQQSTLGVASVSMAGHKGFEEAGMPRRTLGKTGLQVSILSFGAGSQFLMNKDGVWEPMLQGAFDAGINLFDTSAGYTAAGLRMKESVARSSEERLGEVLSPYRKSLILSTKIEVRSRDVAAGMKEFEQSLKRLKTDYLDILLVHSLEGSEDIPALEAGLYKEMMKLKEAGTVKFIGFSCMNSAIKSKEMLETVDVDVAILALNATKYGKFVSEALPAAREKNVGVIAMKVLKGLVGASATPGELLDYVWSQPGVATAVVGHVGIEKLKQNIQLACSYKAQSKNEQRELEKRVAHLAGPHALVWARPDYRDGMMC